MVVITFGKPYIDDINIREFDVNRSSAEYVWHKDEEERTIEILEGEGWQLQFENCLPMLLNEINKITIPSGEFHRLIKGYNNLKIKIC